MVGFLGMSDFALDRRRRPLSNCGYQYRQRHLQTVASLGDEVELAKERR